MSTDVDREAGVQTLEGSLRGKIAEEIRGQVEQELVQKRTDLMAGYDRSTTQPQHDRYQSL